MVPTLVGSFGTARCDQCRLIWLIDASTQRSNLTSMDCAHCGQQLDWESGAGEQLGASGEQPEEDRNADAFDVVSVETMREIQSAADRLEPGDLVAVQWEGQLHVKRLVAKPGDELKLEGSRLFVNGERVEDRIIENDCLFPLPWMMVDDDSRRRETRWVPRSTGLAESASTVSTRWIREDTGSWSQTRTEASCWLIYQNRSNRRGGLPAPVWDDYPFNTSLARKLFAVDRLRLRGHADSEFVFEVAFWSETGAVLANHATESGEDFCVRFYDGVPSEGLPVSPKEPVAIRVVGGDAHFSSLIIERLIEYRLRPQDDRRFYPLPLGPDDWFMLGDNVPVSIDSRDWGPIPGDRILGRVLRRQPSSRRFVMPMR